MTTRDEISFWFKMGKERRASYMVVVCDTFDYSDYPHFCFSQQEVNEIKKNPGNMQRIMEVYDLNADAESQLNSRRTMAL
jgi:hypothetical protein